MNVSPKREPVVWSTVVGLIIAAVASYGLNITPEAKDAAVVVIPIIIAAIVARSQVTPVDKEE